MTYEILTKNGVLDIDDDSMIDSFYDDQLAVFAELTDRDMYADVCYTYLINGKDVFCGTMSEMWDRYTSKNGSDFVRFVNGHLGFVAYGNIGANGIAQRDYIEILSESDRQITEFKY